MGEIKVLEGGPLTTIQDLGRFGFQSKGVPQSGVMDPFSFSLGNLALGNSANAPGLECTLPGLQLEFLNDEVICITGGHLSPLIDGQACPMWETVQIKKGSVLGLLGLRWGCRAYICFSGGLLCPVTMGSTSTLLSAGLGGYEGRALREGDRLWVNRGRACPDVKIPEVLRPVFGGVQEVRVVMGPGDHFFGQKAVNTFLGSEFQIGLHCDRMGCRLEGPVVENQKGLSSYSQGIPLGAIQVDGEGAPIVLLRDRQTVGGYPVIATVIAVDTSLFAQYKPGDCIRFKSISVSRATDIYREKTEKLGVFAKGIGG